MRASYKPYKFDGFAVFAGDFMNPLWKMWPILVGNHMFFFFGLVPNLRELHRKYCPRGHDVHLHNCIVGIG